jgi:hypothetical protein
MTIKTYYVSDSGSNANNGLTVGTAWATIAYAVANMDYAGSTGVNIILSGSLSISANLTNAQSTAKPLVMTGPATITISGSSSVLFNGFWTWLGCTFVNNNSSTAMFNGMANNTFVNCTFQKQSGNNSYLLGAPASCNFVGCSFDGWTGSANGILLTTGANNLFDQCTFRRCSEWFALINGNQNRFARCKAVDCLGGWYAAGTLLIEHCYAKIGNYSGPICDTSGSGQYVICNSVFESGGATSLFKSTASIAKSSGNYTRSLSTGSANIVGSDGVTSLASNPYADPSSLDFTLSAELAAITGDDGTTPGPVQASSGGVTGFTGLSGVGRLGT